MTARARAIESPGGTVSPVTPSRTTRGTSPTAVATTGLAQAIASRMPLIEGREDEDIQVRQEFRDVLPGAEEIDALDDPEGRGQTLQLVAPRAVSHHHEPRVGINVGHGSKRVQQACLILLRFEPRDVADQSPVGSKSECLAGYPGARHVELDVHSVTDDADLRAWQTNVSHEKLFDLVSDRHDAMTERPHRSQIAFDLRRLQREVFVFYVDQRRTGQPGTDATIEELLEMMGLHQIHPGVSEEPIQFPNRSPLEAGLASDDVGGDRGRLESLGQGPAQRQRANRGPEPGWIYPHREITRHAFRTSLEKRIDHLHDVAPLGRRDTVHSLRLYETRKNG